MRGREQHLGAGSAVLEFILKINYQPFKIDRKWQRMQIGISQKKNKNVASKHSTRGSTSVVIKEM